MIARAEPESQPAEAIVGPRRRRESDDEQKCSGTNELSSSDHGRISAPKRSELKEAALGASDYLRYRPKAATKPA
jgi:hypothetical protein